MRMSANWGGSAGPAADWASGERAMEQCATRGESEHHRRSARRACSAAERMVGAGADRGSGQAKQWCQGFKLECWRT